MLVGALTLEIDVDELHVRAAYRSGLDLVAPLPPLPGGAAVPEQRSQLPSCADVQISDRRRASVPRSQVGAGLFRRSIEVVPVVVVSARCHLYLRRALDRRDDRTHHAPIADAWSPRTMRTECSDDPDQNARDQPHIRTQSRRSERSRRRVFPGRLGRVDRRTERSPVQRQNVRPGVEMRSQRRRYGGFRHPSLPGKTDRRRRASRHSPSATQNPRDDV